MRALTRTQNSPIFKNASFTFGGTKIGTTQVTNAFQRAAFWKYAKPTGINPSGGQSDLEVGDPLSGTTYNVNLNGFTYHPQELAFFSWFYHQKPSLGVNGWYSDQGTFRTVAAPCP